MSSPEKTSKPLLRFIFTVVACLVPGAIYWIWYSRVTTPVLTIDVTALESPVAKVVGAASDAVHHSPRSADAWGNLGMTLAANGYFGDASRCFQQAALLDSNDLRWIYLQLPREGTLDRTAIPILEAVIARSSQSVVPRIRLGETLLEFSMFEGAEREFLIVKETEPKNARALLNLGRIALQQGNLAEGRANLEAAARIEPANKLIRQLLAESLHRLGEADAAKEQLRVAAAIPRTIQWPDPFWEEVDRLCVTIEPQISRANGLVQQGRIADAIQLLEQSLVNYKDSIELRVALATILVGQQRGTDAEKVLTPGLAVTARDVGLQYNMGADLLLQKKYAQAKQHYEEAIALQPGMASAHFDLGQCLEMLNDEDGAVRAYREAIRHRPEFSQAHFRLAGLLGRHDIHSAEAKEHLQIAKKFSNGAKGVAQLDDYFNSKRMQSLAQNASLDQRPLEDPAGGYVGSESCRKCHVSQFSSWHRSFHRTMTQVASPESVAGNFEKSEVTIDRKSFGLERIGEEFWVKMEDPAWPIPGQKGPKIHRQLVQTTGSHHFQAYWYSAGESRKLSIFPLCFKIEEKQWMPFDSVFLQPPNSAVTETGGRWNTTCAKCHATGVKPGIHGQHVMDTRVAELGISCEACHGEGKRHVVEATRESITNPSRLPAHLSSQVCGQCHSVTTLHGAQKQAWESEGSSYRPGDDLRKSRLVVHPKSMHADDLRKIAESNPDFLQGHFWNDGMVRVTGREFNGLLDSPCFNRAKDADATMTCITCHSLHPEEGTVLDNWSDDQLLPEMRTNRACLQCHSEFNDSDKVSAHSHHGHESAGSNCLNCHMPHTTYGQLKAVRSHQISNPSVQETLQVGRPNACNLCHLNQSLQWTADKLSEWYGIEKPVLSADEQQLASAAVWSLKGDAGQRALTAWSMGWKDAQSTSGTDWMTPFLMTLMMDDYDAVRFISHRSLRSLSLDADQGYDFLWAAAKRKESCDKILAAWLKEKPASMINRGLLLTEKGFDHREFEKLLLMRDRHAMRLNE